MTMVPQHSQRIANTSVVSDEEIFENRDHFEDSDNHLSKSPLQFSPDQPSKPAIKAVVINASSNHDSQHNDCAVAPLRKCGGSVATQSTRSLSDAPSESYSSLDVEEDETISNHQREEEQRYVSFGPLQIRDTLHLEEYTKDEIELCWYQKEE